MGRRIVAAAPAPARRERDRGSAIRIVGASTAFGLLIVSSAAIAAGRGAPGAPYATVEILRTGAMFGVAVGAAVAARADARNARRLCEAIHASAGLVALIGLGQHLRLSPLPIPAISVPGSTFGNRNVAAEAVAMAIPFGLGLLGFGETAGPAPSPARRRMIALFLVLEIGYLAVARARGAWMGGALGIAIFFALRRPRVVHDAVDLSSPVTRTRLALWRRTSARPQRSAGTARRDGALRSGGAAGSFRVPSATRPPTDSDMLDPTRQPRPLSP